MATKSRFPSDLAEAVHSELKSRKSFRPAQRVLAHLFEAMYFASLRTEERQRIVFHIVYLNPRKPDPKPPASPARDRWTFVRLEQSVPVTISSLVKLAKASDPRTSSFAVYHDSRSHLFVWGLVDQGNRYYDFMNFESEGAYMRPGIFQASIAGVGHLIAYIESEKIAELKSNAIVRDALDVLRGGPVRDTLDSGIQAHIKAVRKKLPKDFLKSSFDWNLEYDWTASLCRLLLRAQNYRHGGAFLITPDRSLQGLNIKYRIKYDRLRVALEGLGALQIQMSLTSDVIFEEYIDQLADEIPADLYLDEAVFNGDLIDSRSELDGTIWFISLLSRVDGLVLMNPRLDILGFGVEITIPTEPEAIDVASNRSATESSLREVSYTHYGTRHRSMMRYCGRVPGSIGFVVSQDGDVRVITRARDKLVMWENIRLQLHDFARRVRRHSRPDGSTSLS